MSGITAASIELSSIQKAFLIVVILITGGGLVASSGILSAQTPKTTLNVVPSNETVTNVHSLLIDKVGSGNTYPPLGTYQIFNDTIEVEAIPSEGWKYDHWVVDGKNTSYLNPILINMVSGHTIQAVFELTQYSLELSTVGSGEITATPSQAIYNFGTSVQLTAISEAGWVFNGWSGTVSNYTNPITINMIENTSITATFEPSPAPPTKYFLTVNTEGSGKGTVTLDPPGGSYAAGTEVTLYAIAEAGSSFGGWNNSSNDSSVVKIAITRNETEIATFTQNEYNLTVIINPTNGGYVKIDPEGPYHLDDLVILTESANDGFTFSGWSGAETGSKSTLNITILGDSVVTANFTESSSPSPPPTPPTPPAPPVTAYTLTINESGHGTVTLSPPGGIYTAGTVVTLTATPNTGSVFTSWSGDLSGVTNPATITINGNKAVTAVFIQSQYSLTANVSPPSSGTITRNDNGPYNLNDVVILTESPSLGYTFSAWSGDGTGTGTKRTITITGNMVVTATFTQNTYTLTTTTSPSGGGTITKSPSQSTYHYGDVVTMTETPSVGYIFSAWSGSGTGTGTTRTVTVTANMAVTATFTQSTYSLTVTVNPTAGGTVTKSPDKSTYNNGDIVTLTESPSSGYIFSAWSGSGTGTGTTRTVTVTANMAVTATFTQNQYTLTISASGSGSTSPSAGSHNYFSGSQVQVSATPVSGWAFSHWYLDGADAGTSNPTTVTMNSAHTLQAVFTAVTHTVTVLSATMGGTSNPSPGVYTVAYGSHVGYSAIPNTGYTFDHWVKDNGASTITNNPTYLDVTTERTIQPVFVVSQYTLTISASGSGSISPSTGSHSYASDTQVQVSATPVSGWAFSHWYLDGADAGTSNPTTVTMNSAHTLQAVFTQITYALMVSITGSGSTNPAAGSHTYASGTNVLVTATPATGWSLDHWVLDGSSAGSTSSYTVSMNGAHTIGAVFTQNQYTLSISVSGQGSVTKTPDQTSYTYGTTVQLTAIPPSNWTFTKWSGSLTGSANPTTINLNGNKAVTATFTQNTVTNDSAICIITVTTTGTGSGSVALSPSGGSYPTGTEVTLTAVPSAGSSFDGWSGILTGNSNPATIVVSDNITVSASFTLSQYSLTVNVSPTAGGTVTRNNNGPYNLNDVVTLTETPSAGYTFSAWSGDGTGTGTTRTITITGNMIVTATYTQNTYTLTVNIVGTSCSVTKSPSQTSYTYGTSVQLTPVAATGWTFIGWSGDLSGSANPATIIMNSNKVVTATFTQSQYTLTIQTPDGSGSTTPTSGSYQYNSGISVQVTGTSFSGWQLDHWVLDGNQAGSTNPITVTMNNDHVLKAVYTATTSPINGSYTVSVSGSIYTANNPSGSSLYSGSSAAKAICTALSNVPSGGTVYICAGTYPITSTLSGNNRNDVTITGDKTAVIEATSSLTNMFVWSGSASTHIHGLKLNNIVFDGGLLAVTPISIQYCDDSVIDGIEVKDTTKIKWGIGINLKGDSGSPMSGFTIKNCYIHNTYCSGIVGLYVTDSFFEHNTFVDCAQTYPSGGSIAAQDGCDRCTIRYNSMSGRTDNDGVYAGQESHFVTGDVITDNTMIFSGLYDMGGADSGDGSQQQAATHTGSGIKIYGINSELARNTINWNNAHYGSWPCYNYCIEDWGAGNNIHDNTLSNARVGIGFFSVSGQPSGNNIVTNNHITGCTTAIDGSP